MNAADWKFSIAPMMDWTGTSRKATRDQHLDQIVFRREVPNAVPSLSNNPASK